MRTIPFTSRGTHFEKLGILVRSRAPSSCINNTTKKKNYRSENISGKEVTPQLRVDVVHEDVLSEGLHVEQTCLKLHIQANFAQKSTSVGTQVLCLSFSIDGPTCWAVEHVRLNYIKSWQAVRSRVSCFHISRRKLSPGGHPDTRITVVNAALSNAA